MFQPKYCRALAGLFAWTALTALAALLPARPAVAELTAEQVVIVVNGRVPYSVALGRFYADKRRVPEKNLIQLDLPTEPEISAEDYESKLAAPLRQALADRDLDKTVRCLLSVYGVPYAVGAGPLPGHFARTVAWAEKVQQESLAAMVRNIHLVKRVGVDMPETARVDTPTDRLDLLFGSMPTETTLEIKGSELTRIFAVGAAERVAAIRRMPPEKRDRAIHQLIALYLDSYGLEAWTMLGTLLGDLAPPVPGNITDLSQRLTERHDVLLKDTDISERLLGELSSVLLRLRGRAGSYRYAADMQKNILGRNTDSRAAVDSELALLFWKEYDHESGLANPLHWRNLPRLELIQSQMGRVLMTCRLDGPSVEAVMKMVLASLEAEAEGLDGTVYLDFGGQQLVNFNVKYAELAEDLRDYGDMKVVTEESMLYFKDGQCPDAAIYMGYYSPRYYFDAFTFVPGAVACHLGVSEADDLRSAKAEGWTANLITHGAAAVIGDIYAGGFACYPQGPDLLPMLVSGRLTVCESYWRSVPFTSWRSLLIADPLYNPFKKTPHTLPVSETMLPR